MLDYDELRRSSAMAEEQEDQLVFEEGSRNILSSITPRQRLILALMLFLNIIVLGFLCLVATNRIALPF